VEEPHRFRRTRITCHYPLNWPTSWSIVIVNQTSTEMKKVHIRMAVKTKDEDKFVDNRPRADDFLDTDGDGAWDVVDGDSFAEEGADAVEGDGPLELLSPTAVCIRPGGMPPSTVLLIRTVEKSISI